MSRAALDKRLRQMRFRLAQRRSAYRQREHASGVWFRLRRLLSDAAEVYVISEAAADALVAEGFAPHEVGDALEPPKRIFVLPGARIAAIADKTSAAPRLDATLLGARCWALRPFSDGQ